MTDHPVRVRRIAIKKGEEFVAMPAESFLTLSLEEKVELILHKRIKFYDENDAEIPVKEGARILREMNTTSQPPTAPHPGAERRVLTVAEFLALPVSERVTLLLDRRLQLRNERGEEVSVADALRIGR